MHCVGGWNVPDPGHFPLVMGVISRLRQKVPARICGCSITSDESQVFLTCNLTGPHAAFLERFQDCGVKLDPFLLEKTNSLQLTVAS
jgi:hypothetical protein